MIDLQTVEVDGGYALAYRVPDHLNPRQAALRTCFVVLLLDYVACMEEPITRACALYRKFLRAARKLPTKLPALPQEVYENPEEPPTRRRTSRKWRRHPAWRLLLDCLESHGG